MSGVIAAVLLSGKGGQPIVMWYYPTADESFCNGCTTSNTYDYNFGIISGSGPISWEVHYASSTALCASGYSIIGSGTITGNANYDQVSVGNGYNEGFYRVSVSNSVGSFLSGWVKVYSNCCYTDCACYAYPGGPMGNWGCYNCSPTYECPACEYDCSCDNVFGFGTGGCDCAPEWDACAWCYPNCPYGQTWCPTYEQCPCGESCEPGYSQECTTYVQGVNYSPPGYC